jgi:hypothetical protein
MLFIVVSFCFLLELPFAVEFQREPGSALTPRRDAIVAGGRKTQGGPLDFDRSVNDVCQWKMVDEAAVTSAVALAVTTQPSMNVID